MALFIIYCIDGELDNIKKISLKNCDLECGFRWACRNGHCDIIQYLVNLYKTDINGNINTYDPIYIHAFGELGFTWACMNGHYDIVQYLVNLYKTDNTYKPININNNGFRWACDKGHYNIVRYLCELYQNDNM